jgi:hypothetical protein
MQVKRFAFGAFSTSLLVSILFFLKLQILASFINYHWQQQAQLLEDKTQLCEIYTHKYLWFHCTEQDFSSKPYSTCQFIKQVQKEFHCNSLKLGKI